MNNIALLFLCLLLGIALRVMRRFPDNAHLSLNSFVIHISLPALIILQIHHVSLRPEHLFSIAMPWIMFSIGVGFFWVLSARLRFSRETTGALMLSGGLANTSFVGLPMMEAFFELCGAIVRDRRGDDQKHQIDQARIRDRVLHSGRQKDEIVLAHDVILAGNLHQAFAFKHVVDLLLKLMLVPGNPRHRLIHRNPVIEVTRARGLRHHQWLRQRAAEVIGEFAPRHFGDIAHEGAVIF
jgi:hypothetical protein